MRQRCVLQKKPPLNIIKLTWQEIHPEDCCTAWLTLSSPTAQTSLHLSLEFALDSSTPVLDQAVTRCKSSQQLPLLKNIQWSINENLESEEEEQPVSLSSDVLQLEPGARKEKPQRSGKAGTGGWTGTRTGRTAKPELWHQRVHGQVKSLFKTLHIQH